MKFGFWKTMAIGFMLLAAFVCFYAAALMSGVGAIA